MSTENALAVYEKVSDPVRFATEMAKATAALVGCSPDQGQAVALTCLVEGITPLEFKRTYHLIQGSPAMRADAMLAKFRNAGGRHKIVERTENRAAILLTSADGETFENEFTRAQAEASRWPWKDWGDHSKGLKDNWATPTDFKAMLWARLVSDSVRAFAPEIVAGIYTPEELADANVVDTKITTDQPARPSAIQAMAAANGTAVAVAEEQVEDAQFEPVNGATEPRGDGYASRAQIDRILNLVAELQAPLDQALAKRGVNAVHSLTVDQAQELIDKLAAKKQQMAPAGN